jgi:hypothetical protein
MRYIDADALLSRLPDELPYKGSVKRVLIQAPTADVAPKSEVAREIFEEIYEDCFDQYGYINYDALAELKKKYTGVEDGDGRN